MPSPVYFAAHRQRQTKNAAYATGAGAVAVRIPLPDWKTPAPGYAHRATEATIFHLPAVLAR